MATNETMVGTSVSVARRMAAPAATVFAILTDARRAGVWMGLGSDAVESLAIDARVGGTFRFVVRRGDQHIEHHGEYLEVVPDRRVVFTWIVPSVSTQRSVVAIDLLGAGEVTQVLLSHEGILAEYQTQTQSGWSKILDAIERAAKS